MKAKCDGRRGKEQTPGRPLRVAIVNVPYGNTQQRVAPLGAISVLSYVQEALPSSIETTVFDFASHAVAQSSNIDEVVEWQPDIVGFSVYTEQVHAVVQWARALRHRMPSVVMVAGGPHPTLTWENFIQRWGQVFSYVVCGDGEDPMLALVNATLHSDLNYVTDVPGLGYLDGAGNVVLPKGTAPFPLTQATSPFKVRVRHNNAPLVYTDPETFRQRRAIALVSSRSCPLQCSFCAIVAMTGKWRAIANETVMSWLVAEHEKNPFEHIYFLDANFFVVPRQSRELSKEISQQLPGISWSASTTVGMLLRMKDDLPTYKKQGLRFIEMGVESGSDTQLKVLNKRSTVQDNLHAISALQNVGIGIGLDYIMFYPGQTIHELQDNLMLLRNANLTLLEGHDHLFNALKLYPGTPLREHYETVFSRSFDPDEVPDVKELFVDQKVANVYRLFTQDFAAQYLDKIDALEGELKVAASSTAPFDPEQALRLRLQAIRVKHIPFKILWQLSKNPDAGTLHDAVPWMVEFDDYCASVRALFDQMPIRRLGSG